MKNLAKDLLIMMLTGITFPASVYAAQLDTQQQIIAQKEQEQASKRAEQDLQYRVSQSMAKSQQQSSRLEAFVLPVEENSFRIKRFVLYAPKYGYKFTWIDEYLAQFNGQRIGVNGINELLKRINQEIINRGYVTTRVYVGEQDLSKGKFVFSLVPGIVGDIKFRNENTWGTWHNAVCMKRGSILNIRDIEQTIDNFNNVPSQSADIKIEPGSKEGESNLVIDIKRSKPWTLMTSVDNSGTKTTGRAQMSATLQLLQPFSANDVFYASWNEDATQSGERKGTRANSL